MLTEASLECGGDISASQEDVAVGSSFLGGDGDTDDDVTASQVDDIAGLRSLGDDGGEGFSASREDVFSTPPQTNDDAITTCTLPFTPVAPSPPPALAPPAPTDAAAAEAAGGGDSDQDAGDYIIKPRRKPRVCTRKVRGSRYRIPAPSGSPNLPPQQSEQQQERLQVQRSAGSLPQQPEQQPKQLPVDPLARAVLMIPCATTRTAAAAEQNGQNPLDNFIAIARQRGFL